MITYHYTFNLSYFFDFSIDLNSFLLKITPPIFSACFLFVSGYSSNLSKNSTKRGFYVLFWGMIITLVTFFVLPEAPIYFGILHCIGIMMILKGSLLNKISDGLLLGLFFSVLTIGFMIKDYYLDHDYLLFLGLISKSFSSLDYYPLIPHGAYFILGLFFARKFKSDFLINAPENKIGEAITLLGKNSLKVYLLHQPLFFLIYFFIKML